MKKKETGVLFKALFSKTLAIRKEIEGREKEDGCCWCHNCQKYLFGNEIGKPEHDEHTSTSQPHGEGIYNQAVEDILNLDILKL